MRIRNLIIFLIAPTIIITSVTFMNSCDENFTEPETVVLSTQETATQYVLNANSKKIHKPSCGTGARIKPINRKTYSGNIDDLFKKGYTTCGNCF